MAATNHRLHDSRTSQRDRATRAARVAELRRKIASGRYPVDANLLAATLVERARFHQRVKADLLSERSPRAP